MPMPRLVAAVLFSLSLSIPVLVRAETVHLANGEWAPYMSQTLKNAGVMSRIVEEAFARQGIQVEYSFSPWKRAFEDAKNGRADGTLIWGRTEERAGMFLFSDPVIELKTMLFYAKDKGFDWSDTASLSDKRLGGVIGYSYGVDAEERAGLIKIERIAVPEANYVKLLQGRIDAVLEDLDVGLDSIAKLGLVDKITYHPKPMLESLYFLLLNRKNPANPAYLEAFNKGLKAMQEDGSYRRMLEASRAGEYRQ